MASIASLHFAPFARAAPCVLQPSQSHLRVGWRHVASAQSSLLPGKHAEAVVISSLPRTSAGSGSFLLQRSLSSAATPPQAAGGSSGDEAALDPQQYSLLRIAGDGRCMFRSLAQGDNIAAQHDVAMGGVQVGVELLQPQAETARADELRQEICQELLKRRNEICWFIDQDYDSYVRRMQQPHSWGGEPELAVAVHVLRRPIAVFTQRAVGVSLVTRYGDEQYAERHEVPLFFHGGGHYDLLMDALRQQPRSRL